MSSFSAYHEWKQLFDKNIEILWSKEPNPILRNISMLLYCITKEFNNIKSTLNNNILEEERECNLSEETNKIGNYSYGTIIQSPEIKCKKSRKKFNIKKKKLLSPNDVISTTSSDKENIFEGSTSIIFPTQEKINKDKTMDTTDNANETNNELGITDIVNELSCQEASNNNKTYNDDNADLTPTLWPELDASLNSAMLIDNNEDNNTSNAINSIEKDNLNNFLAKVQNVPIQLEAAPKILGKKRKKLPGWVCRECENFYLKQGLKHDDILLLNKCTKHRGIYKPREDTFYKFNFEKKRVLQFAAFFLFILAVTSKLSKRLM